MKTAHRVTIPSDLDSIYSLVGEILQEIEGRDFDENSRFAIRLALDEALINAHKHGNQTDTRKKITVSYEVERDSVRFEIEDEGDGFAYHRITDPRHEESLRRTSGRGIFLIRHFMSHVGFNEKGNRIRFRYDKKPEFDIDPHGLSHWRLQSYEVLELDPQRVEENPTIVLDSIQNLLKSGKKQILLDLKFIETISSALLGMIVGAHQETRQLGGELILIRAQQAVILVIMKSHLDGILSLSPDIETILARENKA